MRRPDPAEIWFRTREVLEARRGCPRHPALVASCILGAFLTTVVLSDATRSVRGKRVCLSKSYPLSRIWDFSCVRPANFYDLRRCQVSQIGHRRPTRRIRSLFAHTGALTRRRRQVAERVQVAQRRACGADTDIAASWYWSSEASPAAPTRLRPAASAVPEKLASLS